MKFYDLLIVDKDDHRMDVSRHFEPGTKLVFQLVADELNYYYEAERVVENGKSLPVCAKVGQISEVDKDDSDSKNVAFKKHNIKNLSERMLSASFGEDFDTTAGVEANPLSDYIDDF